MKSKFFLLMVMISSFIQIKGIAQDIIFFKNGNELKTKVTEVTNEEVKYKKYTNLNGPNYSSPANEISMIKYENGETVTMKENLSINPSNPSSNNGIADLHAITSTNADSSKGYSDGFKNYKNYREAGTGTFATTVFAGAIVGLIPAIACSTTKPAIENLEVSTTANEQYVKGYQEGARKKKARKVWTNYGVALIPRAAIFVTVTVVYVISNLSFGF